VLVVTAVAVEVAVTYTVEATTRVLNAATVTGFCTTEVTTAVAVEYTVTAETAVAVAVFTSTLVAVTVTTDGCRTVLTIAWRFSRLFWAGAPRAPTTDRKSATRKRRRDIVRCVG